MHVGNLPPNEFASQIGHAVQEIHPVEPNNYTNESSQPYDVLPPGVEPPPPGFENEVRVRALYFYFVYLLIYNGKYNISLGATKSTPISIKCWAR